MTRVGEASLGSRGTVELLKERGISCEEPLAFDSEFEKTHSRYWRLFGLDVPTEDVKEIEAREYTSQE